MLYTVLHPYLHIFDILFLLLLVDYTLNTHSLLTQPSPSTDSTTNHFHLVSCVSLRFSHFSICNVLYTGLHPYLHIFDILFLPLLVNYTLNTHSLLTQPSPPTDSTTNHFYLVSCVSVFLTFPSVTCSTLVHILSCIYFRYFFFPCELITL